MNYQFLKKKNKKKKHKEISNNDIHLINLIDIVHLESLTRQILGREYTMVYAPISGISRFMWSPLNFRNKGFLANAFEALDF